jgi:hypothetical protein
MPYASNIGLGGVNNQYGARDTGGAIGPEHGRGANWVLKIDLSGRSIADAIAGFVPPVVVPKGANFNKASLRVDEAFVVTGTTPTLQIGAVGSVATNGIVVSEAELEAIGTKELASAGAGTWAFASATGTTAAAKIGYALGGTTPVVDPTVGKATLILEYTFNTKI